MKCPSLCRGRQRGGEREREREREGGGGEGDVCMEFFEVILLPLNALTYNYRIFVYLENISPFLPPILMDEIFIR